MTMAYKKENSDQLADDFNNPEDFKETVLPEKKVSGKMPRTPRWIRKTFLVFLWETFILILLLSYPFLNKLHVNPVISQVNSQATTMKQKMKLFPVQTDRSIKFDSFIIPFEEHGRFTYISLSISFELPNKELMDEMAQKNTLLRGIIYSILIKNIKILTNVSSLENLKKLITHNVNDVLTAGKVKEPIISDFSMV